MLSSHVDHEPGSIDLVMTDVLWERDAIPEWSELAQHAKNWLKDDGLLVTYMGTHFLPQLMQAMQQGGLFYQWMFVLHFDPNFRQKELTGIYSCYRPAVCFSKHQQMHDFQGMADVIRTGGPEKDFHKYQQETLGVQRFVEHMTKPGQLVLDPCMGTATTAIACLNSGRRFIGCDRDVEMFNIAEGRVNQHLASMVPEVEELAEAA